MQNALFNLNLLQNLLSTYRLTRADKKTEEQY